jgi:hypothetical protein
MNVSDKATYKAGSLQYLPQFFSPNAVKIVRWPVGAGVSPVTHMQPASRWRKSITRGAAHTKRFYTIFEKVIRPYSLTHEEVPFPTPVLHHFYVPDHYITILLRSIPQNTGKKHLVTRGIGPPTACPQAACTQARVEGSRPQTV